MNEYEKTNSYHENYRIIFQSEILKNISYTIVTPVISKYDTSRVFPC